jgi:hypothetical protein
MDLTTVLEIIKITDNQLKKAEKSFRSTESMSFAEREYYAGKVDAYDNLINHLHSFIESQLNAAENQTM